MGYYNDYRVVVKPKPEFLSVWKAGVGVDIHPELEWLSDGSYPGVWGIYKLDSTPSQTSDSVVEFRGNSKWASIEDFIDVIEQLDDFVILIHQECNELITAFAKIDTQLEFKDDVFRYDTELRTLLVHTPEYEIDVGDGTCNTEATPRELKPITLGGQTWLSTESLRALRWEAFNSKHFDELMKLVDGSA